MKTGLYFQDSKYAVGDVRPDFIFDPSLVLYLPLYKLDGASFMSKDAYGHLCTVSGALWTPRGRDFDGVDDYIAVASAESLNPPGSVSVMAWVKTAVPDEGDGSHHRIAGGGNTAVRYVLEIRDNGHLLFGDYTTADVRGDVGDWGDNWHFVAGVLEDAVTNGAKIYFDVELINSGTIDRTPNAGAQPVYIGTITPEGPIVGFDGLIGEVLIYNRALSALEIQHNYLATKWRYQ